MRVNSLYDKVNLYEISMLFKNYTTLTKRTFFEVLLKDVSICTENDAKAIDKYTSKDVPGTTSSLESMRNLIEKKDKKFLSELRSGCDKLVKEINTHKKTRIIYEKLFAACNNINFPTQYLELKELYEKFHFCENTNLDLESQFLISMISHAIKNYDTSSPKFYCNRLYQESLTLEHGTKMQKHILKEIVEVAIESDTKSIISAEAASQYANLMFNNHEEAYKYFLIASEKLPSAYWEIGFLIERHRLSNEIVVDFDNKISKKAQGEKDDIYSEITYEVQEKENTYILEVNMFKNENDNIKRIENKKFLFNFDSKEKNYDLLVSFKNYFYISHKLNFTKGWNSLGKYLLQHKTILLTQENEIDKDGSIALMMNYFQKAMALGNINAMVNLGNYYYQKFEDNSLTEDEKQIMLNMLENAANMFFEPEACELLGNYYYKLGMLDTAEKYYKDAFSSPKQDKYRHYMLGKIYKDRMDYEKAINEFQIAISTGYYNAAYECVMIWYEKMNTESNENARQMNKHLCQEYCKRYINLINDDLKLQLKEIQNLL